MSTIALFINPQTIKATTYVDENVDEKYIRIAIELAQRLWIRPIIGSGLFDELQTQINAATLTALNTTLLSTYIQPAMEYWTLYELVEPMLYKFQNKNIAKKNSDNSNPIDLDEAVHLKNKFKNIAESYTDTIKLYLLQNTSNYPLYSNPGTGVDVVHPGNNAFSAGWYLGGTNGDGLSVESQSDREHYS